LAGATQTPANSDLCVPLIVGLLEPPSVTDDRPIAAQRASPRQQRKRDLGHPGAILSSASGSAIKRINGWREGPPVTVSCESFDLLAGPSPSRQISFERKKEYCFPAFAATPHSEHWPVFWRDTAKCEGIRPQKGSCATRPSLIWESRER
jgi:hypothetical protein